MTAPAVRVGVVSDTHLPRRGSGALPAACREALAAADLIVHAGDHADMAAVAMLRAIGPPVVTVHGNADQGDVRRALPADAQVEVGGLVIAVTHDGGPEQGRLARLRQRFPGAGAVVFGHSHIPLHAVDGDGFFILNPGSPTDRRRQPRHTMAEILVRAGAAPHVRFLAVDDPPGPLDPALIRRGG